MMYKFQHYPCNESAEQIYHSLAEMQHKSQRLCIGLRGAVNAKHLYYCVMLRACTVRGGHQDGHAAGGKAGQTCHGAYCSGRRQAVESQIQFKIVANPDAH